MLALVGSLKETAEKAQAVAKAFNRPLDLGSVIVEGRPLETLLTTIREQITATLDRYPLE
jgi:hypothetical protein